MNGRLHGYYLLVEPVDKQFCRRNYPGERSSIYKPYYNLAYKSDSIASYTEIAGERKVGGGETSLLYVMEACKSVDRGTDIEKHVDVESIMKYLALQTMAVNFDCMTGHNMQNWYLHEGCGRISIIPWDYNLAWGGYPDEDEWEDWPVDEHSNERDEEGLNSWMNFSRPSEDLGESTPEEVSLIVNFPIDTPFTDDLKKRTFFMNLLSNDMYKAMYYHYLEVLCRRYVRGGRLSHTIKTIKREIGKTAGTEPNAFYTNKQFQEGVRTLDKLLQLKAQSVMGQMKGTVPSTWDTQKAHPEKLIDCKGLNLRKLGGLGY